jgi:hypothetical protein
VANNRKEIQMRNLSFIYPSSSNLGDDIQTLAALQFMPNATFVDRDKLKLADLPGKLILNGWWTHDPLNAFPPPDNMDVLPISMHINEKAHAHFRANADWFKGKKVLARDVYTNLFLQSIGVDSSFGGCLTLTLPRNEPEVRRGVLLVDAKNVTMEGQKITHRTFHRRSHELRRMTAQSLLDAYQKAELVITRRLHCALPCAAMGTPVVLIGDNPRFDKMNRFVPIIKTVGEFNANKQLWIDKAKNFDRTDIEQYADKLKQTVTSWSISH